MKRMTKAEAKRKLGIKTDYALAKFLGVDRAAVCRYGRMIPDWHAAKVRAKAGA